MSNELKLFLQALALIMCFNLPFYLIHIWAGVERPIIDIDYAIPLIFLILQQRILFLLSFLIVAFFDFLSFFGQIFPFIRLEDAAYLMKFSLITSSAYKIYIVSVIVVIVLQGYFCWKLYNQKINKYILVFFNVIMMLYFWDFYHDFNENMRIYRGKTEGYTTSQIKKYFNHASSNYTISYSRSDEDAFYKELVYGATNNLFLTKSTEEKILLIVNESWGVPADDKVQQDILSGIKNNQKVQDFNLKSIEFDGYTVAGELRELCQRRPIHYNLRAKQKGFENCLPNRFKAEGFETISYHGAISLMYDRKDWYPRAGFNHSYFMDKGLNLNSRCFSFPGVCDIDIAENVLADFEKNKKVFVYWLTLNTHSTYDLRDLKIDHFNCEKYSIEAASATCRNLKLQKQFFLILENMINSGKLSNVKVIVVGDHKPPITNKNIDIFYEKLVPVLSFKVN